MYAILVSEFQYLSDGISAAIPYGYLYVADTKEEVIAFAKEHEIPTDETLPDEYYGEPVDTLKIEEVDQDWIDNLEEIPMFDNDQAAERYFSN